MVRIYDIEWHYTKDTKYGGDPFIRHTTMRISSPVGKTEVDAKNALNLFMKQNGNLKKVTVLKIKEFDEHGQIGEDIIPSDNNSIVPSGR